jgi:CBS-domain-containing membrane protein
MIPVIDAKFCAHKGKYTVQCLLAAAAAALILLVLDFFSNAAIIAALGASAFIAFAMPRANVSRPRFLLGGYLMGIGAGTLCYWLWQAPFVSGYLTIPQRPQIVPGAVAVGLSIFLMTITNTEHPPASGVALGLVLGDWKGQTILVIAIGIVALVLIKTLLRPILINLIDMAPRGGRPNVPTGPPASGASQTATLPQGDEP